MLRPLEITLTHIKNDERNIQREKSSAFSKLVQIENKDLSLNADSRQFKTIPTQAKNTTMSKALKEKRKLKNEKISIENEIVKLSLESNKIKYKKDTLQTLIQTKKKHIEELENEKKDSLLSELSINQLMHNHEAENNSRKISNENRSIENKTTLQIEANEERGDLPLSTHLHGTQNIDTHEKANKSSSENPKTFESVLESKNSELEVIHITLPEQESHLKVAASNTGVSVEVKHDGLHEKEKRTLEEAIEEILKNQGVKTKKVRVIS